MDRAWYSSRAVMGPSTLRVLYSSNTNLIQRLRMGNGPQLRFHLVLLPDPVLIGKPVLYFSTLSIARRVVLIATASCSGAWEFAQRIRGLLPEMSVMSDVLFVFQGPQAGVKLLQG